MRGCPGEDIQDEIQCECPWDRGGRRQNRSVQRQAWWSSRAEDKSEEQQQEMGTLILYMSGCGWKQVTPAGISVRTPCFPLLPPVRLSLRRGWPENFVCRAKFIRVIDLHLQTRILLILNTTQGPLFALLVEQYMSPTVMEISDPPATSTGSDVVLECVPCNSEHCSYEPDLRHGFLYVPYLKSWLRTHTWTQRDLAGYEHFEIRVACFRTIQTPLSFLPFLFTPPSPAI